MGDCVNYLGRVGRGIRRLVSTKYGVDARLCGRGGPELRDCGAGDYCWHDDADRQESAESRSLYLGDVGGGVVRDVDVAGV